MTPKVREWMMLWIVKGRPHDLPFSMFRCIPLEAFKTHWLFNTKADGVCYQIRYEAHPDFQNRYSDKPFVMKIWNYGSANQFEKGGDTLDAVLEIARAWHDGAFGACVSNEQHGKLPPKERDWMMRWTVMGRPSTIPFKMFAQIPIHAFEEVAEHRMRGRAFHFFDTRSKDRQYTLAVYEKTPEPDDENFILEMTAPDTRIQETGTLNAIHRWVHEWERG